MSEEIKDDTRRKVTAVGNSWIVCKSKSHAGHVYYFNTLTGEAAWNLSDSEIEKAKNRTKILEHLPDGHPTRCPEPKDKPPTLNLEQAPRELSESFLINTVSEKQSSVMTFSNIANNNTSLYHPLNQLSGLMHTQITNPPVLDCPTIANLNLNSLNNSISTFNLNTAPIIYNPKVWAVPHTQQVFVSPTMAPIVNTTTAGFPSVGLIANTNLSQTMSNISSSHTSLNDSENRNKCAMMPGSRTFHPRCKAQGGVRNFNNNQSFTRTSDLRQKLCAKKRFNDLPNLGGNPGGSNNPRAEFSTHIASNFEGIQTSTRSIGEGALENNCMGTQLHESPSKIDLTPLQCLAPSDSNSDAWFIIADLGILLNEFKFLTSLTDSDDQCHLMVPKRVMDELKSYVTCTQDIQSRRILRFLSHQIEIGYAFAADQPSEVNDDSMTEAIYATCTELSKNKYHLILLSNDNELLTHQNPSNIKIFSIEEIKKILGDNPHKQLVSSIPKKPITLDGLIKKIKITVPNDTLQNTVTVNHKDDSPVTVFKSKETDTQDKTIESTALKQTVDAGIQTDFEDINASISISNEADKQEVNRISTNPQHSKEIIIRRPVPPVLKVPDKKREIKLKRSTSNQPVPSADGTKKQFRWRRRRNTSPQVLKAATSQYDQNRSPKNVETLSADVQPYKLSNGNSIYEQNENKIIDYGVESRESSITADQRNPTMIENVTIEETSTSGIISNTESNVDNESNYSYSTVNQEHGTRKCNMYEIENITMEQYLKIKSDEWVSRFIQIMEEALTQVLQQHPPFSHSAMPPPWTLHEASQCITIKFRSHQDIVEAANKLATILFDISDAKVTGKITVNMTPRQYMQMYSYGVHLLDEIMKVNNNCVDIQIAQEALKKLLDDIKNQNMDGSANDTFTHDNIQDNLSYSEVSGYPDNLITNCHDSNALHEQETSSNHKIVQETFNISCKKRKLNEEEQPKPVQFIRKINLEPLNASLFFETLKLKKCHGGNNSILKLKNNVSDKPEVQLHENHIDSRIEERKYSQSICENDKCQENVDIVVPSNQPRIIRSFSIYPDLEEKIKKNSKSKVHEVHDDIKYNEKYAQYITRENKNHNEQRNEANVSEDNKMRIPSNENNDPKDPKSPQTVDHFIDDSSKKFKYVMYSLLQEIRNTLCQVRILCDQCKEELKNPEGSTKQKCQLQKMAERAHLHVTRLCRSLESMLDHGTNNSTQSMRNLLKQADINICHVDDLLLNEYRMNVAKCKDFADVLSYSIRNIISAFKS